MKAFLLIIILFITGCSAKSIETNAEFHDWLKQTRNYKKYKTEEEAKKAFDEVYIQKQKEKAWKDYKIEHGILPENKDYYEVNS